jgi:hypothetical protein
LKTASGFFLISTALGLFSMQVHAGANDKQSIRRWVSCDGKSDDGAGVARAFAAAKHAAFTLVVDCPVRIHVGMDITRPIFIDEGTAVVFTGAGKFTIDNVLIPAFVIVNSSHIALNGWNVEYDAALPVVQKVGGHERNGRFTKGPEPANAFNDLTLTPWLAANRGIVFDRRQGTVNSKWSGATNTCAVFFVAGDSADVRVTGMRIYVSPGAGGERFIPVVFSLDPDFKSNQTVTSQTPLSGAYFAVPHDLTFSDITLDGTYMGWVGGVQNAVFENITSHRYADLQDINGGNVGGMGKWFAPPHLFYLSFSATGDPALYNKNIRIQNVVDDGPRIGAARDKGGTDSLSGYALSLKIGCVDCSVDNYRTNRPDGFLDVLPSDGLKISNAQASYDSSFLNNVFPGWRFPSSPYKRVTFENIVFQDVARSSARQPIGDATQASNERIVFKNVQVKINRWAGPKPTPLPTIVGQGNDVSLDYVIQADSTRLGDAQKGTAEVTLRVRPFSVSGPAPAELSWTSRQIQSCAAGGAWNGAVGATGSRTVQLKNPGNYEFTLTCQSADAASVATRVTVSEN